MKKLYKSVKVKLNSNCITEIWTLCGYFVTWTRELTVLMASNWSYFDWVARYISRMDWDASSVMFMGSLRYPKPLSGFLCSFSDGTYGLPLRSSALSKSCQSLTDWLANPPAAHFHQLAESPPVSASAVLHQLLVFGKLLLVGLLHVFFPAWWSLRRWSHLGGVTCALCD